MRDTSLRGGPWRNEFIYVILSNLTGQSFLASSGFFKLLFDFVTNVCIAVVYANSWYTSGQGRAFFRLLLY